MTKQNDRRIRATVKRGGQVHNQLNKPKRTSTETGLCYVSAFKTIQNQPEGPGVQLRLVHGRPTLTRPPHEKYGHAWIELNDAMVFDSEKNAFIPKAVYYKVGNIDESECYKYTALQATTWADKTHHYGPWEGPDAQPTQGSHRPQQKNTCQT